MRVVLKALVKKRFPFKGFICGLELSKHHHHLWSTTNSTLAYTAHLVISPPPSTRNFEKT